MPYTTMQHEQNANQVESGSAATDYDHVVDQATPKYVSYSLTSTRFIVTSEPPAKILLLMAFSLYFVVNCTLPSLDNTFMVQITKGSCT